METRELKARIDELEARLAGLEKSRVARLRGRLVLFAAIAVIPAAAYAAVISAPNTFTNGTAADANEVNTNFTALVDESNDQDGRLTALEDELQLAVYGTSTSTGDTVPESYYLSSPPIVCDASSRGRIFIGRPSANDQDSLCYCGEFSSNYNVYCFNP